MESRWQGHSMNGAGHDACGCDEYNTLSRRNFIIGSAGAAVFGALAPAWIPKVAFAKSASSTRDVIVNIFQRGGADGLSLLVPFTDVAYYLARPKLNVPRPGQPGGGTAVDNTFMFSPGIAPLYAAYQSGELLVIHGAGLSFNSRSHFDAQHFIETGKDEDPFVSTGWLGRHLATSDSVVAGAALRGVATAAGLPDSLRGAPQTLPIPDPANYAINGNVATRDARTDWLASDFTLYREPGRSAALNATRTLALLRSLNIGGYAPSNGAVYPTSAFGTSLRSAAALIKADIGVEAIQVDIGGWDTHGNGNPNTGLLFNLQRDFASAIAAFWADVMQGNGTYNVTLLAMSEFGRNLKENGTGGTDHGRGGVMFVMGHRIAGGRVMTQDWRPLTLDNLADRQDVRVTIDHRDVLAEIVENRLGNQNLGLIFPGYTPTIRGITR